MWGAMVVYVTMARRPSRFCTALGVMGPMLDMMGLLGSGIVRRVIGEYWREAGECGESCGYIYIYIFVHSIG